MLCAAVLAGGSAVLSGRGVPLGGGGAVLLHRRGVLLDGGAVVRGGGGGALVLGEGEAQGE